MNSDNYPAFSSILVFMAFMFAGLGLSTLTSNPDNVGRFGGLGALAGIVFLLGCAVFDCNGLVFIAGMFILFLLVWGFVMFMGILLWQMILHGDPGVVDATGQILGCITGTAVLAMLGFIVMKSAD